MDGHLDAGTKVWRAYIPISATTTPWLDEGVVTDIIADGKQLVRWGNALVTLDDRWHTNRTDARRDIHATMVRNIGLMQAEADKMADELLHETLAAVEVG